MMNEARKKKRENANRQYGREITARLITIIEKRLEDIGMPEGQFFAMIGCSRTTMCQMRKGATPKAENIVAICLALGIDMNQTFAPVMPNINNFLAVFQKKMEDIRRHEAIADKLRNEMNVLIRTGRKTAE